MTSQHEHLDLPEEIIELSNAALENLCPVKSKERYQNEFNAFIKWLNEKKTDNINETVLLAYFSEMVIFNLLYKF